MDDVQFTLRAARSRLSLRLELPRTEAAPLGSLENVRAGARERLAGSPCLRWLADSKGLVFRLSSVALYNHFGDTGCLYSKSPDRNASAAFEASAAASEPFL